MDEWAGGLGGRCQLGAGELRVKGEEFLARRSKWVVMGDAEDPAAEPVDRIEPATPSLENTLFVLLGVVSTLFVIYRMVALFL